MAADRHRRQSRPWHYGHHRSSDSELERESDTGKAPTLPIVENDLALPEQMKWSLARGTLAVAQDRDSALLQLRRHLPAVVTMDVGLPPDLIRSPRTSGARRPLDFELQATLRNYYTNPMATGEDLQSALQKIIASGKSTVDKNAGCGRVVGQPAGRRSLQILDQGRPARWRACEFVENMGRGFEQALVGDDGSSLPNLSLRSFSQH